MFEKIGVPVAALVFYLQLLPLAAVALRCG